MTFTQGIVWAAARIIELHDQAVIAEDVLKEAQLSKEDLKECAEYDLKILRKHIQGIPRGRN